MSILRIKDNHGNVQEILALRGPRGLHGVDAYEKVRKYGYEGTEKEFYLAMGQHGTLPDKTLTKEGVAADAAAVGAGLADVKNKVADCNDEIAYMRDTRLLLMQSDLDYVTQTANLAYITADNAATTTSGIATIMATDWLEADGKYQSWFDSGGIDLGDISDIDVFISVNTGSDQDMNVLYKKAFSKIIHIEKSGPFDFVVWATKKPDIDIPVQIKVVK